MNVYLQMTIAAPYLQIIAKLRYSLHHDHISIRFWNKTKIHHEILIKKKNRNRQENLPRRNKKEVNVFVMDPIVLHPTQQCGNMETYQYVTKGIKFEAYLNQWKLIPLYLLKMSSRCRVLTAEI